MASLEEHKMINETRKILATLPVCATCVRVPVFVGHSISVNVELESNFDLDAISNALGAFDGIVLHAAQDEFPYGIRCIRV